MSKASPLVIGVDLGGTNVAAAAVREGRVLAFAKTKTHASAGVGAVLERIEEVVREAVEQTTGDLAEFDALCIGAPGAIDPEAGVVRDAPNLGWTDIPLGDELRSRLGLPVLVDNDVTIAVLGEHAHGAGQGARHLIGVWVGTGIGGGMILDGKTHRGWRGAAGEIGHIVMDPEGRRCGCGRRGCIEAYASKTGIEEMLREMREEGRESVALALMEERESDRLTSGVIAAALEQGDGPMKEVIDTAQFYLGLLTADLVNTLDPEVIVFGGGLVERLGAWFVDPIARTARTHVLLQRHADRIRIVPSALGDDAGPVGAAVMARRRHAEATA